MIRLLRRLLGNTALTCLPAELRKSSEPGWSKTRPLLCSSTLLSRVFTAPWRFLKDMSSRINTLRSKNYIFFSQLFNSLFYLSQDRVRKTYMGMVTAMDEAIGNITDTLKEANIEDNTIIIFTTDNGGTDYRSGGSNYPLRGTKVEDWCKTVPWLLVTYRAPCGREALEEQPSFTAPCCQYQGLWAELWSTCQTGYPHSYQLQGATWPPWWRTGTALTGWTSGPSSATGWGPVTGGWCSTTSTLWGIQPGIRSWEATGPSGGIAHIFRIIKLLTLLYRSENYKLIVGPPGYVPLPPLKEDQNTLLELHGTRGNQNNTKSIERSSLLFDLTEDEEERNDLSKMYPEIVEDLKFKLEWVHPFIKNMFN